MVSEDRGLRVADALANQVWQALKGFPNRE
jgi:hypothetical protein